MNILVAVVILSLFTVALTALNVLYAMNIKPYVEMLRRGMVRVKIRYEQGGNTKVLRGWSYGVDLKGIIRNPVSHSSSFVKVYVKGSEEVVLSFSSIKELKVLDENYFSVVLVRRVYL